LFVETGTEYWIVEAKVKADEGTIYKSMGQLLFYRYLWETYSERPKNQLRLTFLCPRDCSDISKRFLDEYNIEFVSLVP